MNRLNQVYENWVSKRSPSSKKHILHQGNLFIFPSLLGGFYLLLVFILWLLGTNYNNNLILALSYLLVSVSIVCIFHTYKNMKGLRVVSRKSSPVFCGDKALIHLQFERENNNHHLVVSTHWKSNSRLFKRDTAVKYDEALIDWKNKLYLDLFLPVNTVKRGLLSPPKLVIKSYYPLGLLKCWSYLTLDEAVTVYPKPLEYLEERNHSAEQIEGQANNIRSVNTDMEFQDLQAYREGESMAHIAWKQYARTGDLYRKNFETENEGSSDLRWDQYRTNNIEKKLQYLAYDALSLSKQGLSYRLLLPNQIIESDKGDQHLTKVLTALAMFHFKDNNHGS